VARVEAIAPCVFAQPVERGAAIVYLRRIFRVSAQTILHRGDGKAAAREMAKKELESFVSVFPASAMNPEDEREGPFAAGLIEIEGQPPPVRRRVHQVPLDRFALRRRRELGASGE